MLISKFEENTGGQERTVGGYICEEGIPSSGLFRSRVLFLPFLPVIDDLLLRPGKEEAQFLDLRVDGNE